MMRYIDGCFQLSAVKVHVELGQQSAAVTNFVIKLIGAVVISTPLVHSWLVQVKL